MGMFFTYQDQFNYKGYIMATEQERPAIRAEDLVDAWNNDVSKVPQWLYNYFITKKIHVSEGAVYLGDKVARKDDWIIEGLEDKIIICPSETFERIRQMLKEKAEAKKLKLKSQNQVDIHGEKMKNQNENDTDTPKDGEIVMIMNRHERRKQAAIERKRAKDELRDKKNKSKSNPV